MGRASGAWATTPASSTAMPHSTATAISWRSTMRAACSHSPTSGHNAGGRPRCSATQTCRTPADRPVTRTTTRSTRAATWSISCSSASASVERFCTANARSKTATKATRSASRSAWCIRRSTDAPALAGWIILLALTCGAAIAQELPAEESAQWYVWRWYWERGIRYDLELPFGDLGVVPAEGPVLGTPLERRLALIGRIGGRVQVDAAGYGTARGLDHVDAGAELRRFRFGTRGDFYLVKHASYAVDIDIIDGDVEAGDIYLWWDDIPWIRRFKIGNFTPPMAIESVSSSRDLVFMEPALPVDAFGPARASGIQLGGPVRDERLTWSLALVRTLGSVDEGDRSEAGGRVVGRLTWLAQDDRPRARLTHLGAAAGVLVSPDNVHFRTEPESHIAPALVDTGTLQAADQSATYGLELLHVRGPWLLMSEALAATVTGAGTVTFWGAYALVSHSFTGEPQPYDRTSAVLGRFEPVRPLSWRERTLGALRAGLRVSHVDLEDGPVAGGRETNLGANLTWVLNR